MNIFVIFFIKEQKFAKKIAFLKEGVVRAYFTNLEGKEYDKQFYVGESIIGAYTSLLTRKPNLIAQQALTDCELISCNFEALTNLFDECSDLERFARKIAEYYFLEKEQKEIDIVLLDATERYALFQQKFPGLEQQIAQFHIASYLGISATQLSRIRKQLSSSKN